MKTIRIDERVYEELQRQATPFVDTPNSVLRSLLGLEGHGKRAIPGAEPAVFLIPHSSKEFKNAEELRNWLKNELAGAQAGRYQVVSRRGWRNVFPGAKCLFHKDKVLVGEAIVGEGLDLNASSEDSPVTGQPYIGWVTFEPASVRIFPREISLGDASTAAGVGLTWRSIQRLTPDQYRRIVQLIDGQTN